jgi:hypothetical protein
MPLSCENQYEFEFELEWDFQCVSNCHLSFVIAFGDEDEDLI